MPDYTHLFNAPKTTWPELILHSVFALYETVFPKRVRSLFLLGSLVEGSSTNLSDIDAVIVFKDDFVSTEEMCLADAVINHCKLLSPLRLDIQVISEKNLRDWDPRDTRLSLGATLIFGTDTRSEWCPVPSLEDYQAYILDWALMFVRILHRVEEVCPPLAPPIPSDPYLGYATVHRQAWYPSGVTTGTKELVATVCWVATALLAHAGVLVASRGECLANLSGNIDKDKAEFVETIYAKCRSEWHYAVPNDSSSQKELQQLCVRSLNYFNSFIEDFSTQP